jgi:hypothetical protein
VARYSSLEPLTLEQRRMISAAAMQFFSPINYRQICEQIGKAPAPNVIHPLSIQDFVQFLELKKLLPEADRYQQRIRELIERLTATDILTKMGHAGNPFLGGQYYCLMEMTDRQHKGVLWLSPVLGPDNLYNGFLHITVHLTGVNRENDVRGGTGILVTPKHILTCAHVLKDMQLDNEQMIQGNRCKIIKQLQHPKADVAVLEVDGSFENLPDLCFRDPTISETIYLIGFPSVQCIQQAPLLMQRGEVISPIVTGTDWAKMFLFSAIARPGNSGGPIVSDDGMVLGLVIRDLGSVSATSVFDAQILEDGQESQKDAEKQPAMPDGHTFPFFAAIPSSSIREAVFELIPELSLPTEA